MVSDSERTKILEMIESGTITAEDGLTLLKALGESAENDDLGIDEFEADSLPLLEPEDVAIPLGSEYDEQIPLPVDENVETFAGKMDVITPDPAPPDREEINKWKRWWLIPLWIGTGITMIGGLLMFWAVSSRDYGFWFACSWFPFLLGVAIIALAWSSRTAPWLHVRVHQAPGKKPQKIAISFPIPIRLTVWGFRAFGHHIPHMEGTNLDEVILALKDISQDETPLIVDVDDAEDGERVQVFIG